ncbi:MAG: hypothetical protein ACRDLQ_07795 [Solirubrobacterales bacterium]
MTLSLAAALAAAPAAAGDTLVHADPTAENVTAYGGVLMWSRRDPGGPHHLVQRVGAIVSDAPVASSAHPLDPDLGAATCTGSSISAMTAWPASGAVGATVDSSIRPRSSGDRFRIRVGAGTG